MKLAAPIDGTVHRQLGHVVSQTRSYIGTYLTQTTTTYGLRPMTLSRPAGGRALTHVFCPSCQKNVGVIVASEAETLKVRKRWRIGALACGLIVLLLAPVTASLIFHGELFAILPLFFLVLACIIVIFGTYGSFRDDGISVKNPSPTQHRVLPADFARRRPSR
jgi:hypothetical protein